MSTTTSTYTRSVDDALEAAASRRGRIGAHKKPGQRGNADRADRLRVEIERAES